MVRNSPGCSVAGRVAGAGAGAVGTWRCGCIMGAIGAGNVARGHRCQRGTPTRGGGGAEACGGGGRGRRRFGLHFLCGKARRCDALGSGGGRRRPCRRR